MARGESKKFKALYFNHFEVTNVGANHDLMELFTEEIDEPEPIQG